MEEEAITCGVVMLGPGFLEDLGVGLSWRPWAHSLCSPGSVMGLTLTLPVQATWVARV